jgi:hypothetical protein
VFQKRFNMLMAAVVYYPADLGNWTIASMRG